MGEEDEKLKKFFKEATNKAKHKEIREVAEYLYGLLD